MNFKGLFILFLVFVLSAESFVFGSSTPPTTTIKVTIMSGTQIYRHHTNASMVITEDNIMTSDEEVKWETNNNGSIDWKDLVPKKGVKVKLSTIGIFGWFYEEEIKETDKNGVCKFEKNHGIYILSTLDIGASHGNSLINKFKGPFMLFNGDHATTWDVNIATEIKNVYPWTK